MAKKRKIVNLRRRFIEVLKPENNKFINLCLNVALRNWLIIGYLDKVIDDIIEKSSGKNKILQVSKKTCETDTKLRT